MGNKTALSSILLASAAFVMPTTAQAQEDLRGNMVAQQPARMDAVIAQWEYLTKRDDLSFASYANFINSYSDFPKQDLLQRRAENALDNEAASPQALVSFFDRHAPLTNSGRARYALALASMNRSEAFDVAREAWRNGTMSGPAELYLVGLFGSRFAPEDHDARMDALLWQGNLEAASRHIVRVSPAYRQMAQARLALLGGSNPAASGIPVPQDAMSDAGYVYNLTRHYRSSGQPLQAVNLLGNRANFAAPAFDGAQFVTEALAVAKSAGAPSQAVAIASKIDDVFAPGADISDGSFTLRDKYTDLMWLGGTKALWSMGDGNRAAPLFYRYGTAAKTPLTRSKGFYWAGRAASRAGDRAEAQRYWELAAEYPEWYYGQLALKELGRPVPSFAALPQPQATADERAAFYNDPLTQAIRTLSRNRQDWRTERAFFEAIADKADTPAEMALLGELARETGLEEMAVVAGLVAGEHGLKGYERIGFPTVDTHSGANWTMVHAIARQESEFDRNRVSHAGARGMMQLMPGTAREEAGKIGVAYMSANLTESPSYNIRLGDAHFARLMDRYNGAYPLAIAAYNAGPGRVNEWLRLNGDPRTGAVDWVTWIEQIPANFETRYYVMRVIGNAVAYANMHPDKSTARQRDIASYLPR
ncbi:lytic transglycosylase domain-containing protein [Qipengyuania sp. XHP0207]|uniref:lytic transglycosylase domain-containing protein n=1 Tax=Qipengyuania sp. XHP0207 TaxID=3038078 RepID=UPI00241D240E|nr:lytic transglycosylase domain-containing protein [Qipengyuania sp. XHP0207]MDG5747251.1 lytic transglycosylase domain-containing protein [Qipengyuania sp. XHP0207]